MSDVLPEGWKTMHISRSFRDGGHPLENNCPCPQEPCGYVARDKVVTTCKEHRGQRTIRDSHRAEDCPGHGSS